jgi:hypothetical protein
MAAASLAALRGQLACGAADGALLLLDPEARRPTSSPRSRRDHLRTSSVTIPARSPHDLAALSRQASVVTRELAAVAALASPAHAPAGMLAVGGSGSPSSPLGLARTLFGDGVGVGGLGSGDDGGGDGAGAGGAGGGGAPLSCLQACEASGTLVSVSAVRRPPAQFYRRPAA